MMDGEQIAGAACGERLDLFDDVLVAKDTHRKILEEECRRLCSLCPIAQLCLEETIELREDKMFRAGLSPREWRRYFKNHPVEKAA